MSLLTHCTKHTSMLGVHGMFRQAVVTPVGIFTHLIGKGVYVGCARSTLNIIPIYGSLSSQADEEEEEDQPLSLSWPESNRKRFTYLFILPIVFPLWMTLPDVRKPVSLVNIFCFLND